MTTVPIANGLPMDVLMWAVPLLPAIVGAALAVTRPGSARLASGLTLATAVLTLVLTVITALAGAAVGAPFLAGASFGLAMDPLAGVVAVTVAVVAVLVLIFAAAEPTTAGARFGGLMLIFVAAVLVTVAATTVPTVLFAWELMGATSYALIGFHWSRPGSVTGGLVAFLTTRAADLGLYVAAGAALAGGAGLALADLPDADPAWRSVIAAGIVVSCLGKAAQLPFAFWISRAMEGPSAVSALLHSAAMVAMGGFLLLRIADLLAVSPLVAATTAWVGALTTVALGLVALAQTDLKQVLAASTAAQLGFVVLAAGVGGVSAGTVQLVAHAATKALLFLVAGAWLSALGTKQLLGLRGAARRWKVVGVSATVGLLTLAGIAPLSLWAAKEAVLTAANDHALPLYLLGLLGAALSAGYAGRVLRAVWSTRPADVADLDTEEEGTRRIQPAMGTPLVALGAAAAGLGVLVLPPVFTALGGRLDEQVSLPSATELIGSAVLALAVTAAAWRWAVPAPGWARAWLNLEPAAHRVLVIPTDALAARLARFDDGVLDRSVDSSAHAGRALAAGLARFDDGVLGRSVDSSAHAGRALAARLAHLDDEVLDRSVEGVAGALRRAGRLARRPQSGQLHHYYLQSIAVLVAVAVFLLLIG